jgi:hypothetical protein
MPPLTPRQWTTLMGVLVAGDQVCREHGRVDPRGGHIVPACPCCGEMLLRYDVARDGHRRFTEPTPSHCAGPGRHPLSPGATRLGWRSCDCLRDVDGGPHGHRTWRCDADGDCADVQTWPPCLLTGPPAT